VLEVIIRVSQLGGDGLIILFGKPNSLSRQIIDLPTASAVRLPVEANFTGAYDSNTDPSKTSSDSRVSIDYVEFFKSCIRSTCT
jgi:hypothetical protein